MRILGFGQMWPKLQRWQFSTFRFPRRDKDWQTGEKVQVVYKPRTKNRRLLGVAEIVESWPRYIFGNNPYHLYTEAEAVADGFDNRGDMERWLIRTYGLDRLLDGPMNKLTLRWVKREVIG